MSFPTRRSACGDASRARGYDTIASINALRAKAIYAGTGAAGVGETVTGTRTDIIVTGTNATATKGAAIPYVANIVTARIIFALLRCHYTMKSSARAMYEKMGS